MNHPLFSLSHMLSYFRLFRPCKKHLAGKYFTTDINMKQAVTAQLQTLDTYLFYVRIQVLVPWRDKCVNISGDYVEVWYVPSAACVPHGPLNF